MERVTCQYCDLPCQMVSGRDLYNHRPDLWAKVFYRCPKCGAYVGCHPGTIIPLGKPAHINTRQLRMQAHRYFDRWWREHGIKRNRAYKLLAAAMQRKAVHIGSMNEAECKQVVEIVKQWEQKDG